MRRGYGKARLVTNLQILDYPRALPPTSKQSGGHCKIASEDRSAYVADESIATHSLCPRDFRLSSDSRLNTALPYMTQRPLAHNVLVVER